MEDLLSHAFDNLSSITPEKRIRGLRQIDAVLAQICLSRPKTSVADRRRSVIEASPAPSRTSAADKRRSAMVLSSTVPAPSLKQLCELRDDAAFREFFKLQERFEWNVASRLVGTLDKLMGKNDSANDLAIANTLELIQGVLLLHPPSRRLFSMECNMTLLIDLLDPDSDSPSVLKAALATLVTALLGFPLNTRLFESLSGLQATTSVLENEYVSRSVRALALEFIYFYLMPETPSISGTHGTSLIQSTPSKLGAVFSKKSSNESLREVPECDTRTTFEKQDMLSMYLGDKPTNNLVKALERNTPYGGLIA